MKYYFFEYTDTTKFNKLVLLCFVVFILILILLTFFKLNFLCILFFCTSIPLFLMWSLKKRIVKRGNASIDNLNVEIQKEDCSFNFSIDNIEYYLIDYKKNNFIRIKKDGKLFLIGAMSGFCNSTNFQVFCKDLLFVIENYKEKNLNELKKEKYFFQKKPFFIFLVLISATLALFTIIALIKEVFSFSFLIAIVPLVTLWSLYLGSETDN